MLNNPDSSTNTNNSKNVNNSNGKRNRIFWGIVALIAVVIVCVGGILIVVFLKKPISPPLDIITPTPTMVPTEFVVPTETAVPVVPITETCGHSDVMTILLLARDISSGEQPYGADMIRFVRIDFSEQTVRMIAVPRDLWVSTPHLNTLKIENSRLGPVFYYVEQATLGTWDQKAVAGTNALAQTLYDNFQVTPDNYIFFEMRYFADVLNLLGGVDVNIPRDLTYGGYSFKAGPRHLDGQTALIYARLLPVDELTNGWDRLERQNLILEAVREKLLDPANIVLVPALIDQFKNDIVTDLSPALIADLACMLDKVPREQLALLQIEASMITGPGPDDSMLPDMEKVRQFLQQQLAP